MLHNRATPLLLTVMWLQLLFSAALADKEYFVSTAHIAQLSTMQNHLADALLGYANNETVRLDRLRKIATDLKRPTSQDGGINVTLVPDIQRLSHPVEAFLTIKRMGHDWRQLLGNSSETVEAVLNASGLELPKLEDYEGAIDALLRLQDVYGISAESMARGQLTVGSEEAADVNTSAPVLLSANDCIHLVRRAFVNAHNQQAVGWIRLLLVSDAFQPEEKAAAIPAILDAMKSKFNSEQSKNMANYMLGELWNNVKKNVTAFQEQMQHLNVHISKMEDKEHYRKLCKDGSYIKSNVSTSHLVCRHVVPHPFYTLAPLKEEILSADPWVVFLYDVLTNAESTRLMQIADPLLKRAKVAGGRVTNIRISKSAFLGDSHDWSVRKVNRKLGAITRLNETNSDALQMGNYGIGGQYEPHMDSFLSGVTRGNNRVATVLLYLNNVEQGGGTVFTRLGLRVMPVKNGALFWYNMRRNSSDITDTTHAACPVLRGSKWVANKWIYYLGQMHHRPCSLNQLE